MESKIVEHGERRGGHVEVGVMHNCGAAQQEQQY